jgi:hypothetical protein
MASSSFQAKKKEKKHKEKKNKEVRELTFLILLLHLG